MERNDILAKQKAIIGKLGVKSGTINPVEEVEKRVTFIINKMVSAGAKTLVLGISGGQDSFNGGALAQIAVDRLNKMTGTKDYKFIAVRLPYGIQRDEEDAMASIEAIQRLAPDTPIQVEVHNIKGSVDKVMDEHKLNGREISDFLKGNIKARHRMAVQYDIAGATKGLVIGTDHAAEAITGFYTKWGDGACDLTPLSTLNKRQGRELAKFLGAPEVIITKKPTADLEDNNPGLADEDALGLTYDQIDDFLEGKEIELAAAIKLINQYNKTEHKREAIPGV